MSVLLCVAYVSQQSPVQPDLTGSHATTPYQNQPVINKVVYIHTPLILFWYLIHSGGCTVADGDRVALNTLKYASPNSTGAHSSCFFQLKPGDTEVELPPEPGPPGTYGSMKRVCHRLPPFALRAGARSKVYFDPNKINAAIVTAGKAYYPGTLITYFVTSVAFAAVVDATTFSEACFSHLAHMPC